MMIFYNSDLIMPAGYSNTPLIKKLGIAQGSKVLLLDIPDDYFDLLEVNIRSQLVTGNEIPDLVHVFARSKKELLARHKQLKKICTSNPQVIIWVSWYKKSSGIATDLTEDLIRKYALENDLVDIKVCAVSTEWSGLKLVVPRAKR